MNALVPAVLASLIAGSLAWSAARPPQDASADAPGAAAVEPGDTPLMALMEKIEHAEHFLRKSIADPGQDAASLEQIDAAQRAILAAKLLPPKMTPNVPEPERPRFLADYRKMMAALLIEFCHLERALLDGDRDAAKAAYKRLHLMEEEGHNSFTDGG